jgi:membrane-bound lytic murein transglycosylase D
MFSGLRILRLWMVMLAGAGLCMAQPRDVFLRLQQAEEFWYPQTGLRASNELDTCMGVNDMYLYLRNTIKNGPFYDQIALEYASFFSRHRCEALSLYEEIAQYYSQTFTGDHYAAFLKDHLYLAVYLTGLYPGFEGAYDRKGIWSLTYPVAVKYGLRVDEEVDERLQPQLATKAFWWYFFDMQRLFGNADLVSLALVTSPTQVEKFIQKGMLDSENGSLPMEARQMLFELDLLKAIFQPDWFRIRRNRIQDYHQNLQQIRPAEMVRFDVLAKYTRLTEKQIQSLNPVFVSGYFPKGYQSVAILLPTAAAIAFQQQQKKIFEESQNKVIESDKPTIVVAKAPASPTPTDGFGAHQHVIKSGENLQIIADAYGVSLSDLMGWNQLTSDRIFAGQRLLVYLPILERPSEIADIPNKSNPAPPKPKPGATAGDGREAVSHVVQSGETLWKISQRFQGVSPEDIMRWNNLRGTSIVEGQTLIIKAPSKSK